MWTADQGLYADDTAARCGAAGGISNVSVPGRSGIGLCQRPTPQSQSTILLYEPLRLNTCEHVWHRVRGRGKMMERQEPDRRYTASLASDPGGRRMNRPPHASRGSGKVGLMTTEAAAHDVTHAWERAARF